jgi:hypothetical protein
MPHRQIEVWLYDSGFLDLDKKHPPLTTASTPE